MDNLIAANVKQRPLRTAISVIGVSLGVILVVLTVGLARGLQRDSIERQTNVDAELRLLPPGNFSTTSNPLIFRAGYAEAILKGVRPTAEDPDIEPKPPIPGVAATSPVGEMIQSSGGGIGFEMVDGIDFPSFAQTSQLRIVEGRALGDGRAPGSEYEAIIDRYYSENNRASDGGPLRPGSRITVLGNEFTVVGIYEPPILGRVKVPLYTMQQLFGGADNCTFVMIKTERPELADQVKESIERYYPGNRVIFTRDLPALYSQGINAVEIFLDVVIGLAMVISTLVILLAMYTTIIERTREIGILKSLGASKRFIIMSIEKEAALIALMGVLFGFLVSVVGKFGIEQTTRLKIDIDLQWLAVATAIALSGGLIGALYPAIRAANLDPVEAISYE